MQHHLLPGWNLYLLQVPVHLVGSIFSLKYRVLQQSVVVQTEIQVSGHGTGQVLAKKAFQKCKCHLCRLRGYHRCSLCEWNPPPQEPETRGWSKRNKKWVVSYFSFLIMSCFSSQPSWNQAAGMDPIILQPTPFTLLSHLKRNWWEINPSQLKDPHST